MNAKIDWQTSPQNRNGVLASFIFRLDNGTWKETVQGPDPLSPWSSKQVKQDWDPMTGFNHILDRWLNYKGEKPVLNVTTTPNRSRTEISVMPQPDGSFHIADFRHLERGADVPHVSMNAEELRTYLTKELGIPAK